MNNTRVRPSKTVSFGAPSCAAVQKAACAAVVSPRTSARWALVTACPAKNAFGPAFRVASASQLLLLVCGKSSQGMAELDADAGGSAAACGRVSPGPSGAGEGAAVAALSCTGSAGTVAAARAAAFGDAAELGLTARTSVSPSAAAPTNPSTALAISHLVGALMPAGMMSANSSSVAAVRGAAPSDVGAATTSMPSSGGGDGAKTVEVRAAGGTAFDSSRGTDASPVGDASAGGSSSLAIAGKASTTVGSASGNCGCVGWLFQGGPAGLAAR